MVSYQEMLDCIRQQWPDLEKLQCGHTETAKVSTHHRSFTAGAKSSAMIDSVSLCSVFTGIFFKHVAMCLPRHLKFQASKVRLASSRPCQSISAAPATVYASLQMET